MPWNLGKSVIEARYGPDEDATDTPPDNSYQAVFDWHARAEKESKRLDEDSRLALGVGGAIAEDDLKAIAESVTECNKAVQAAVDAYRPLHPAVHVMSENIEDMRERPDAFKAQVEAFRKALESCIQKLDAPALKVHAVLTGSQAAWAKAHGRNLVLAGPHLTFIEQACIMVRAASEVAAQLACVDATIVVSTADAEGVARRYETLNGKLYGAKAGLLKKGIPGIAACLEKSKDMPAPKEKEKTDPKHWKEDGDRWRLHKKQESDANSRWGKHVARSVALCRSLADMHARYSRASPRFSIMLRFVFEVGASYRTREGKAKLAIWQWRHHIVPHHRVSGEFILLDADREQVSAKNYKEMAPGLAQQQFSLEPKEDDEGYLDMQPLLLENVPLSMNRGAIELSVREWKIRDVIYVHPPVHAGFLPSLFHGFLKAVSHTPPLGATPFGTPLFVRVNGEWQRITIVHPALYKDPASTGRWIPRRWRKEKLSDFSYMEVRVVLDERPEWKAQEKLLKSLDDVKEYVARLTRKAQREPLMPPIWRTSDEDPDIVEKLYRIASQHDEFLRKQVSDPDRFDSTDTLLADFFSPQHAPDRLHIYKRGYQLIGLCLLAWRKSNLSARTELLKCTNEEMAKVMDYFVEMLVLAIEERYDFEIHSAFMPSPATLLDAHGTPYAHRSEFDIAPLVNRHADIPYAQSEMGPAPSIKELNFESERAKANEALGSIYREALNAVPGRMRRSSLDPAFAVRIDVMDGDITQVRADALIAAIDPTQAYGNAEVDQAIRRIAGERYHRQVREEMALERLTNLEVVITHGKHMEHRGLFDDALFVADDLTSPMRDIIFAGLETANERSYRRVSFAVVRPGTMPDFPDTRSTAEDITQGVANFSREHGNRTSLQEIVFVVPSHLPSLLRLLREQFKLDNEEYEKDAQILPRAQRQWEREKEELERLREEEAHRPPPQEDSSLPVLPKPRDAHPSPAPDAGAPAPGAPPASSSPHGYDKERLLHFVQVRLIQELRDDFGAARDQSLREGIANAWLLTLVGQLLEKLQPPQGRILSEEEVESKVHDALNTPLMKMVASALDLKDDLEKETQNVKDLYILVVEKTNVIAGNLQYSQGNRAAAYASEEELVEKGYPLLVSAGSARMNEAWARRTERAVRGMLDDLEPPFRKIREFLEKEEKMSLLNPMAGVRNKLREMAKKRLPEEIQTRYGGKLDLAQIEDDTKRIARVAIPIILRREAR